jgi:hypothetical protein
MAEESWGQAVNAEAPERLLNRLLTHITSADERLRGELARLQSLEARANAFVQVSAEVTATTALVLCPVRARDCHLVRDRAAHRRNYGTADCQHAGITPVASC